MNAAKVWRQALGPKKYWAARLVLLVSAAAVSAIATPLSSAVLFWETGTPDSIWSDDGDGNDWMLGHTEQDVINAGWSGTQAESSWLLDPWHNPGNKVLAVKLLKLSPDKADAQDVVASSWWRDTIGRADVPWTLFCSIGLLYDVEPGFTETIRLDLKAQGTIVDSVSVSISGNGFSNWIFMGGSVHEPDAEVSINNWAIQVFVGHLSHATVIAVMVDDIFVYESQEIGFIVGRDPQPGVAAAVEAGSELNPIPLPTIAMDPEGDMILTWRSIEGYTYDVERNLTNPFARTGWEKTAEGLSHDPSGTILFSDEGAAKTLAAAYYRIVVYASEP